MLAALDVLAGIAWNPEIRNILSLLVGLGVLIGSVYLILGTNTGIRTGMLITLAGLFGWMAGMGAVWWMYGIGMKGEEPSWRVVEVNHGNLEVAQLDEARLLAPVDDLPTPAEVLETHPELEEEVIPEDNPDKIFTLTLGELIEADPSLVEELGLDDSLGGWELLPVSDRQRGDAAATADAGLGADGTGDFESSAEYSVRDAFSLGGKPQRDDDSLWGRFTHKLGSIWSWSHPTHYAIVQIQVVVPACETETGVRESTPAAPCITIEEGAAPPAPKLLEDAPVISVIMVRDLGDKRFPAAMITVAFGALFALTCWSLHRRDKLAARGRAAAPA